MNICKNSWHTVHSWLSILQLICAHFPNHHSSVNQHNTFLDLSGRFHTFLDGSRCRGAAICSRCHLSTSCFFFLPLSLLLHRHSKCLKYKKVKSMEKTHVYYKASTQQCIYRHGKHSHYISLLIAWLITDIKTSSGLLVYFIPWLL